MQGGKKNIGASGLEKEKFMKIAFRAQTPPLILFLRDDGNIDQPTFCVY